ncbi:helix-turn-helix domain-containing protein [Burkholderia sp. B21-007]|uniref:helix-turn-helix domain-containing protein n=1 Tax=Burkholderia sp. B21-007 TaxID=2890407 RepID=UPI001E629675|nr:helix-turn-helix transcriptional regulator [Burkholderia sp. B21-007]UEP31574.1 helix-turn-helix domain-containing protein [Burkholderia sp. B21-007]
MSKTLTDVVTVPRTLLQDLVDDVADYAASRDFRAGEEAWRDDILTRARALLAAQQPEPIAWESTTVGYTKYITDERYQKFSHEVRKWYKPYRCSACMEPRDEVTEQQPSFTNPLTPYGMLVRALRIVAGVTLMDMATALLTTPAKLSAMEFGRAPVTPEFAFDVAAYFDALDVPHTASALRAAVAARAGGQHADQA